MRRSVLCVAVVTALLGASPAPIVQPAFGGTPWSDDAIAQLDADIGTMLDGAPTLRGAHYGIAAVDTATGKLLVSRSIDDEIQPASTLKLVVGSAALEKLGPQFAFRTTLGVATAPGTPDAAILRMGGDPTLSSADLAEAARTVPQSALARYFVDDRAFDTAPYPAGWTWDDFAQDYAPNVSAATLDENVVTLRVSPGTAAGRSARVVYEDGRPVSQPLEGCDAFSATRVIVLDRATTGTAGSDDTIDVGRTRSGCPEVIGSIPLGAAPESIGAAVYDPLVAVWSSFGRALQGRGAIERPALPAAGAVDEGLRPPASQHPERVVWTHDSKPLGSLLGPRFWIPSDNLFGELLLRELGLVSGGAPGSTEKGIAYEKTWLQSIGVDPATVTLADGCGMSQYDRITPRDLVTILQHDWNGPNRQLVLDSLPVGGARGTIEGIAGTSAAGRVFAKTGSMMHVRGLAGYLATQRHGAVTFAFSVDDWNGDYPALAALRAQVLSRIVDDSS